MERYVHNLSKKLVQRGHEVEVVTSGTDGGVHTEILDGISVTRCPCLIEPMRNPIAPTMFALDEKINAADIVHVHNVFGFPALAVYYYKKRYNTIQTVLTHHGQLAYGGLQQWILRMYEKVCMKGILNCIDNLVVLSESDATYMSPFMHEKGKIHVIPNAMDFESFQPHIVREPAEFLDRYGLRGKKVILFVGQILRRKGIDYLVRSVCHIRERMGPGVFSCVIVGDGDYLKDAKRMADSLGLADIQFTGKLSFPMLVQAYQAADIFTLPSLSEGLPTCLLEAMYFNLPIVATDIPGIRDYFREHADLVPPRDEKALAEAIIRAMEDGRAGTSRLDGRSMVETKFSWEKVVQEYERLYTGMTARQGSYAPRAAGPLHINA